MEKNYGKNPEVARLLRGADNFEKMLEESPLISDLVKRLEKLEDIMSEPNPQKECKKPGCLVQHFNIPQSEPKTNQEEGKILKLIQELLKEKEKSVKAEIKEKLTSGFMREYKAFKDNGQQDDAHRTLYCKNLIIDIFNLLK